MRRFLAAALLVPALAACSEKDNGAVNAEFLKKVESLPKEARSMALANLAVEAANKCGYQPADKIMSLAAMTAMVLMPKAAEAAEASGNAGTYMAILKGVNEEAGRRLAATDCKSEGLKELSDKVFGLLPQ